MHMAAVVVTGATTGPAICIGHRCRQGEAYVEFYLLHRSYREEWFALRALSVHGARGVAVALRRVIANGRLGNRTGMPGKPRPPWMMRVHSGDPPNKPEGPLGTLSNMPVQDGAS